MADEYRKLSREELDELAGEALPERAAMSLINANIAIPINAAVAANVLSEKAIAYAGAAQRGQITQGTCPGGAHGAGRTGPVSRRRAAGASSNEGAPVRRTMTSVTAV